MVIKGGVAPPPYFFWNIDILYEQVWFFWKYSLRKDEIKKKISTFGVSGGKINTQNRKNHQTPNLSPPTVFYKKSWNFQKMLPERIRRATNFLFLEFFSFRLFLECFRRGPKFFRKNDDFWPKKIKKNI